MAKGDVEVEIKTGRSSCFALVAIVTALLSAGLVAATVLVCLGLHSLDETDAILRAEIEALQKKLDSARIDEQLPFVFDFVKDGFVSDEDSDEVENDHRQKRLAPTNFFDAILQAQESIFEKYCHKPNATCPNGSQGDKGITGDPGTPGLPGKLGPVGDKGPQGDSGAPGFKGPRGDKGAPGIPEAQGPLGPVGLKGLQGDPGLTGPQGLAGSVGPKGTKGARGDTGDRGQRGAFGLDGLRGQKGDTGDRGYNGTRGDRGPQGRKGNDTKKFGDQCECLKSPTFRDAVDNYGAYSQRSVTAFCTATGNPTPDVTVKKISDSSASQTDNTYECVATNMFGSVKKQVTLPW